MAVALAVDVDRDSGVWQTNATPVDDADDRHQTASCRGLTAAFRGDIEVQETGYSFMSPFNPVQVSGQPARLAG